MRSVKIISSILLAVLAGSIVNPVAAAPTKACSLVGISIKIAKVSVPTCNEFYSRGSAIKFPADTAAFKYGVVASAGSSASSNATFFDRNNKQILFAQSLLPKPLANKKEAVQYIFRATFNKKKITSIQPVLFVPASTMLKPFIGTQFLGAVHNLIPADGINNDDWIRWNFNQLDSHDTLQGTFVNLNNSVRVSQLLEPPAPCAFALLSLESDTEWYSRIVGTTDAISMYWDPAMHSRMNSEFVVAMGTGITYMATAPTINVLLKSTMNIQSVTTWTIHGNPMGTPYMFDKGMGLGFVPGFSQQTPVVGCSNP